MSVCGTPAWASSQAVSRAPCRYGRVSSTQTWMGRSLLWATWTTPERRPELATGEWPGVAVGQDPQRLVPDGRRQRLVAERGQPAVVLGRLEDDEVGLFAHDPGDLVAVLGQVADRVVAGHQPVDRPGEVDGRRSGDAQGVGAAADRGPPRVRSRVARTWRPSSRGRSPRPARSPGPRGRSSRGWRRRPRRRTGSRTRRGRRAGGAGR